MQTTFQARTATYNKSNFIRIPINTARQLGLAKGEEVTVTITKPDQPQPATQEEPTAQEQPTPQTQTGEQE